MNPFPRAAAGTLWSKVKVLLHVIPGKSPHHFMALPLGESFKE
jgi:hypothetical protein